MFERNDGVALSAEDCYEGFAEGFGIDYGYYHGGTMPFEVIFNPFTAVIDLKTGIVVKKEGGTSYFQDVHEIISMMQEADE